MSLIGQFCIVFSNPVSDLQLGITAVELALAIEAFCKKSHFHICAHCAAALLALGLAACAWTGIQ